MDTTEEKSEIVLQHGWGLSSSCWDLWKNSLKGKYIVNTPDRGYFCNENQVKGFKTKGKRILISHSFGLYLFNEKLLDEADYLIIISGFSSFHGSSKRDRRRSSILMGLMKNKIKTEPEKMLMEFYNGHDLRGDKDILPKTDLLLDDLKSVDNDEPDLERIGRIKNILIIHGDKDMVVSPSRGFYLKDRFKDSRMILFRNEDHALPFTRTEELVKIISEYIENGELPLEKEVFDKLDDLAVN